MKKKVLIILSVVLICSLSFGFAANKADELNKLKILKGYDDDYQLENQLTRAQAFTFVVRLIGKESLVLDKAELLRANNFTDVDSDQWYAPYTGYGKAFGLIQGYEDGTFRADEYLSEREFYAMVLNALNIDYEWKEVENVAYENNLIESKDEKNEDNYLRGSVVDVLYTTLDNRKDMIDDLVKSGIVAQDVVDEMLISKTDETVTEISSIVAISETQTRVKFNEDIKNVVLDIDNLEVLDYDISGNDVTITNEKSVDSSSYTLTVVSVEDENGYVVNNLENEFIGYKSTPIESNYFMISDIEVISKSQINVYFTQDVTMNAALSLYYDIYEDDELYVEGGFDTIKAEKMGTVDNGITLWLTEEILYKDSEYILKLDKNLSSRYGVEISDNESKAFIGNGKENNKLEIDSLRVLNEKYIRIIFSEDLSDSALDKTNYSLLRKENNINYSRAFNATFTGIEELKYRQIDVEFLNIDQDEDYELTIKDIKDRFDERELEEEVIPFSNYVEAAGLEIEAAVAKNQGEVLVYFNNPVDESNNFNGIIISNPSRSIEDKFIDPDNPTLVTLILDDSDKLLSGNEYDLKVINGSVSDLNGETNSSELNFTLKGTSNEFPEMKFADAHFISDDYVYVRFNVNVDTSTSSSKFRLKYTDEDDDPEYINASSISFINSHEAVVKFRNLSSSESYKIYGDNIEDYSNQPSYKSDEFYKTVAR
ncbi:S-layer homology domain-containing protein [Clostridiaceae bacterium HSG29]|nr:S-layer homology domain-containing protein [Clostridiaceae bacterium HSG29]